jgi:hypothetical protein
MLTRTAILVAGLGCFHYYRYGSIFC